MPRQYVNLRKTCVDRLRCVARVLTLVTWMTVGVVVAEADWPTYRHDPSRSGFTPDAVELPLKLLWQFRSPALPAPAWTAPAYGNLLINLSSLNKWDTSDHAFHAVSSAGHVVFGSSVDDAVHCLRLSDGRPQWKFFAGAPIRMPPTLDGESTFAAADDGQVYCLNTRTGDLRWQRRIGPETRFAPGNGRMISRWPVRGGPLVQQGSVYVSAGVFPLEGVFLAALDAADGATRWLHAIDVVAHGPMVASRERLFVSALRANPNMFDLQTGSSLGSVPGAGAFASYSRDKLISGPSEDGKLGGVEIEIQQAISTREGFQLVNTGEMLVAASNQALVCFDTGLKPLWKAPRTQTHALIVAGNTAFVGGQDEVSAYDLKTGERSWTKTIRGRALGLAAADKCLLVSTDLGDVLCFGPESLAVAEAAEPAKPIDALFEATLRQSRAILQQTRSQNGYALVLGADDEQLAVALAEQSRLQIVGLIDDPAALADARKRVDQRGIYGSRVSLLPGPINQIGFQEQSFNLIVVACRPGEMPNLGARKLIRWLQPYNGTVVVACKGDVKQQQIQAWSAGVEVARIESADEKLVVAHAKPPQGAGEWTHPFADPGHSSCSQDELVRSPFELQWFGPPGPQYIVDRHNRTSPPLFKDGRLLVPGKDRLTAVDAFNGTILWDAELPDSTRLAVSKNCGHVVIDDRYCYVARQDHCDALVAATGELAFTLRIPPVPEQPPREWGYLAVSGDTLLGSVTMQEPARKTLSSASWQMGYLDNSSVVISEMLFAYDLPTRRIRWTAIASGSAMINTTFAADEKHVYCVESGPVSAKDLATGRTVLPTLFRDGAELICRELSSGKVVWRKSIEMAAQHSLFLTVVRGTVLLSSSRNLNNALICDLAAYDAATGEIRWVASEPTGFGIGGSHGEQEQHPLVVEDSVFFKTFSCNLQTGKISREWRLPIGGCGALSASKHVTFFRASTSHFADLETGAAQPITGVTRPGCWLNMLPAGGLLLAPESSAGCTCQYPIQTSLAMRPLAGPPPDIFVRMNANGDRQLFSGDLEFAGRVVVEMETPASDASIHYSFDAAWPTLAAPKYTAPLDIERTTILWARTLRGDDRSGIARRRLTRIETPRLRTPSTDFVTSARVELAAYPGTAKIRYRLDGQSPDAQSTEYTAPFDVSETCTFVAAYFLDDQRTGPDLKIEFRKVPGRKPDTTGDVEPGLSFEYFEQDNLTQLPDFTKLKPLRTGTIPRFVIPPEHRPDSFAVRYTGYLQIPADGMYRFFLRSDDGSELRIGDQVIVSNDGTHDARGELSARVPLAAGKHRIDVRYFDAAVGEVLWVACEAPGAGKREIPGEWLWRDRAP